MYAAPWLLIASWAFVVVCMSVLYLRQRALAAKVAHHLEDPEEVKGFAGGKKVITEPVPEVLPLPAEAKHVAP